MMPEVSAHKPVPLSGGMQYYDDATNALPLLDQDAATREPTIWCAQCGDHQAGENAARIPRLCPGCLDDRSRGV